MLRRVAQPCNRPITLLDQQLQIVFFPIAAPRALVISAFGLALRICRSAIGLSGRLGTTRRSRLCLRQLHGRRRVQSLLGSAFVRHDGHGCDGDNAEQRSD